MVWAYTAYTAYTACYTAGTRGWSNGEKAINLDVKDLALKRL